MEQRKTIAQRHAESRVGPIGPFLLRAEEEGLTDEQMARAADVSMSTIKNWKREHLDIQVIRKLREPVAS